MGQVAAGSDRAAAHRRAACVWVLAAMGVALLAACGGSTTTSTSSSATASSASSGCAPGQSPTTVTYGFIAFAGDAAVQVAQQQDYFRDACLTVNIQTSSSINNVVPGVVGGTYDFGLQSGGGVAVAVSRGIPVAIVANDYFHQHEQELMVKTGGPIHTLKDLVGQTVALGALNNNYEAGLFSLLQQAGVSPSSVKFASVATNQIASEVESGQVAAGQINEPFITEAGSMLTTLVDPLQVFGTPAANAYVIVDTNWADANKDTLKRFLQAYNRAQKYCASNPNLVASVVSSYTGISSDITSKMNLPGWGTALNEQSQQQQMDLMYQYGFLTKKLTDSQVFYQGVDIQQYAS